jgi:hypothetical protein
MQRKDTICPTQVVTMARRERIVPTKLSWRSVTEAMATPPSNTRSESFIFWLQQVENINLPVRN